MKLSWPYFFACFACFADSLPAQLRADGATASFKGSLPPKPTADISSEQQAALEKELATVTAAFQSVKKHERAADADIFLKAVRYALEFHEWYDKKADDGVKKARTLLTEASSRIEALKKNETPWLKGSGVKVLGFYSQIDDSPQPYGVEIPEGLEYGAGKKSVPMWIWLHGRGDTSTDIHFIASQMKSKGGQFKLAGTIVVHPFGRYCNGWKSAGETDVFESKADATKRFNVDTNRIAVAGFSMGGAGAWHLGAHYADQWACVHTGAGFVDVKRYQKLTPEKYPPWYEQKLWGVYDVPDYARNFLNVPLICYSGEIDAQRDSAEYMMEVLGKEGLHPPHLIGPGMPHKYHPETIKEVQKLIEAAVAKGRDPMPKQVHLQFRDERYGHMFWVSVLQVEKPWDDSRIDACIIDDKTIEVTTRNIVSFAVDSSDNSIENHRLIIDGKDAGFDKSGRTSTPDHYFYKFANKWIRAGSLPQEPGDRSKSGGTCIDDVFTGSFVVILPDGLCESPAVDAWVRAESAHFIRRWRSLMRGDLLVRKASEVVNDDLRDNKRHIYRSVVLWGDPKSNKYIRALAERESGPLKWTSTQVGIGQHLFDAKTHVPVFTYPNVVVSSHDGVSSTSYIGSIVVNSGLTFREAHDRTNSLQNPKLPDWAILDITQPPNAESAGKVVAADFFDEHWQVKPDMPPVDQR